MARTGARLASWACGLGFLASGLAADEPGAYPFLLAEALGGEGALEEAQATFDEAILAAPADPFVRVAYAELLARVGKLSDAARMVADARRLAPVEPGVLLAQGRIAMARIERDAESRRTAREAFEALVLGSPDELEAWIALGQLYLADGEPALAVPALERASTLRPGAPMIESLRARALVAAGDLQAAESVQRTLLAAAPSRLDLRLDLAENLSSQGRHLAAEEILAGAPADQLLSPELRRRRAIELLLEGNLETSAALAEPLLHDYPDNAALRLLLASIRQADGEWEAVLELVAPLLARSVVPEPVFSMQLRALQGLGRIEQALVAADERRLALAAAGQIAEANAMALTAAELAAEGGLAEEAERRARALIEGRTDVPAAARSNALWILADLAIDRSDWSTALRLLEELASPGASGRRYEVLRRSGDSAHARALRRALEAGSGDERLALAEAESRLERFDEAIPIFRSVLLQDPGSLRARFGLASALERIRNQEESESEFEKLLADNPDHAPSLNYLGYMRIEAGEALPAAIELVTRAVRMDPSNAAYVDSLGWGFHRLGEPARAVRLLERASRLESTDATILEHLGDALVSAGDLPRARIAYERALALSGQVEGRGLSAKIERLGRTGGTS